MGDKHNHVVIFNTKMTRKIRKYIFANTHVQNNDTHMYTHIHIFNIYTNYRQVNTEFCDEVISI